MRATLPRISAHGIEFGFLLGHDLKVSRGHARSATEWKVSKDFYCGLLSDRLFFAVCAEDAGSTEQYMQEQLILYGTARTPMQHIATEAEG